MECGKCGVSSSGADMALLQHEQNAEEGTGSSMPGLIQTELILPKGSHILCMSEMELCMRKDGTGLLAAHASLAMLTA